MIVLRSFNYSAINLLRSNTKDGLKATADAWPLVDTATQTHTAVHRAHESAVCEVTRWGPPLPGGPVPRTADSAVGRQPCLSSCSLRAEPQPQPGLALDSAASQGWGKGGPYQKPGPHVWDFVSWPGGLPSSVREGSDSVWHAEVQLGLGHCQSQSHLLPATHFKLGSVWSPRSQHIISL